MPPIEKLQPKYDVVFHRLFGDEKNSRLLMSLLNALLGWPKGHRIQSLSLLPGQVQSDTTDDKDSVLDIRAIDEGGRQYNVEVQVSAQSAYVRRMLYYWARLHSSQLARGKPYDELRPTIAIHILDWEILPEDDRYHYVFELKERQSGWPLTDQMQIHVVELREFRKGLSDLLNEEEKWLYFLQNGHTLTVEQAARLDMPEIVEAEQRLTVLSQDQILRFQYEQRFKAEQDKAAFRLDCIAEGLREGRREGQKEGQKEGEAKSILTILEERRLPISDEVRDRILSCKDPSLLNRWLRRALTAQTAADVVNEP